MIDTRKPETTTNILPTWMTAVVIPLTQNILGGLAVGAFLALVAYGWADANAQPIEQDEIVHWALIVGGAVASAATFIRFFGDDVGLIASAYRQGQQSRDAEVAALQLELRTAFDAQRSVEVDGSKSVNDRHLELRHRARRDALKLIEVAFQGDAISRSAMGGRGMGQRDWERAARLLRAASVMDESGSITARNPATAIKGVDERLAADKGFGVGFTPRWR